MHILYKITDKKVRQIVFCPKLKIISEELVSGAMFKQLEKAGKLYELSPEHIIDQFSMFRELMENCVYSRYFTYDVDNTKLIFKSAPLTPEAQQLG